MNRKRLISIAAIAVVAASAALVADVIVNPDGSAFVGKGDVQGAFKWNDATLQANAEAVTFSVALSQSVEQDCFATGGPPITPIGVRVGERTLSADVDSTTRRNPQNDVTGFFLAAPDFESSEWSDIEWQGGGSGDPGGTGCPGGPGESHAGGPPRFGEVVFDAIYATFNGTTKQIYP